MVQSKKEGEKVTQTADNSKFIARIILNGQILLGSKSFFLAWKVAEIIQQGNKLSPNVGTINSDGPARTQITIYFDDEFDSWLDSSDCFPALSQLQTDEGNTSKYDARIMLKGPILPPSKTHAIALKVAESMKQSNKRNKLSPHVDVVVCQDETEITIYFDKPADSSNRSTAPSQLQTGACNTSVTAQEQPDSNDQSNQETTNASVAAESDLLTEDSEGSTSTGSEEANNPAEIAKDYEFAFDFDYLAREFAFDFDYSAREFGLEIDLSALDEPNNSNRYTVPSQLQTDAGNTSKSNTQPKLHMPEPSTGSLTEQEQPDSNEQSDQEITNASIIEAEKKNGLFAFNFDDELGLYSIIPFESLEYEPANSSNSSTAPSQQQTDAGNTSKSNTQPKLHMPEPSTGSLTEQEQPDSNEQSDQEITNASIIEAEKKNGLFAFNFDDELGLYSIIPFESLEYEPANSSNSSTAPSQQQTDAGNSSESNTQPKLHMPEPATASSVEHEQSDSKEQSDEQNTNDHVSVENGQESDPLTEDTEGSEKANNPAKATKKDGEEFALSQSQTGNNSDSNTQPSRISKQMYRRHRWLRRLKHQPSTASLTAQEQPDSNDQSNQETTNASVAAESDLLTEGSSVGSEEANDPAKAAKKDGEEACALDLNSRSESLDKNALSQSQTGTDNTSESDTRPKLHMPEPSTDSLTALEQPDSNDQSNQETTNASVAAESDLLTEDFSEDSEEANDPAEAAKEDDELTFTYTAPVSNSYIFRELYNWRPIRKFDTSFFGYTPPSRYILKHQGPTAVYSSLALASTFIPYKDMSPIVKKCNANRLIELGSKYALDAIRGIFNFDQDQEQWLKVSDLAKALRADGPSQYNKFPISSIINTPILTPYDIVNKVLDNKLPWSSISGETAKGIGYFSAANVIAYKHYTKTLGDHAYPYNIGNPDHWEHPDLLVNNDNDHCDCGSIIRTALLDNTPIVDALSLPNIVHNNVTMPFVKYCQINGCRILELNGKFGFKYGITSEQICEFMDNAVNVINIGNDISALNEFLCISTFVHYICIYEQHISHYQSK